MEGVQLTASLLTIVAMPKPERPPLMLELQVPSKECAPFLVSSTRSLLWVEASDSGVRAGVRQCSPSDLFFDLVEKVADKGESEGWGNVVSSVEEGEEHLRYYGLDPEILLAPQVPWLPAGWAVVVPKDRDYLGSVYDFGEGFVAALIHNAARGMAIVRPDAELD